MIDPVFPTIQNDYEGKNTRLSTLAAKRSIIPDKPE
jgi:hypothetical protein